MLTYNEIQIPECVRVGRIISAFENEIDHQKVERYVDRMSREEGYFPHCIPAILGYPDVVSSEMVEKGAFYLSGEPVSASHIGELVWFVTDGHHRTLAALQHGLPILNVSMDESTFTKESELLAYRMAA